MARYLLVRRSAIPFDLILDFEGTVAGTAISETVMNAQTFGTSIGAWDEPEPPITHTVVANQTVTMPYALSVDGVTYQGAQAKGLRFDQSDDEIDSDIFSYLFSGTHTGLVWWLLAKWDLSGGTSDYNNDIVNVSGSGYAVLQMDMHLGAPQRFAIPHTSGSTGHRTFPYTNDQWVVFVSRITAAGIFETYMEDAATGDLLYASRSELTSPLGTFVYLRLQDYLRAAVSPAGWVGNIDVNKLAFREDTTFPIRTLSIDAPSSVVAEQTDVDTITVTTTSIGSYAQIERNRNSGGFTVIEAGINIGPDGEYEDTDIEEGDTAAYRVSVIIGSQMSGASSSSNTVTVDNAPYESGPLFSNPVLGGTSSPADQYGCQFTVGAAAITITQVGLWVLASQYSDTIGVGVYDEDGVLLASAAVDTTGTPDQFAYTALASPLNLSANTLSLIHI